MSTLQGKKGCYELHLNSILYLFYTVTPTHSERLLRKCISKTQIM